jgi:hypothetical protein
MTTTMNGRHRQRFGVVRSQRHRVGDFLAVFRGITDALIEAGQIAYAHHRHQLVALVHFANTPVEGVGGMFHVHHHRREQVRDALVDRQFEHLRVDQDQPYLVRPAL